METKIQFTGLNVKGTAKIKQIGKENFVLDFDGEYNITENEEIEKYLPPFEIVL